MSDSNSRLEPLFLLDDEPIRAFEADALGVSRYADMIAGTVLGTTGPFTIAIYGDWGHGKTSLLNAARSRLDQRDLGDSKKLRHPEIITVFFNAWRYEREDHPIIPLVATIERAITNRLNSEKDFFDKLDEKGKHYFHHIQANLRGLLRGFSMKMTGELGVPGVAKAGGEIGFNPQVAAAETEKLKQLNKDLDEARWESITAGCLYLSVFDRLDALSNALAPVREAGNGITPRIAVFIDDLDRCRPEEAVEVLERIRLVLAQPGFIFVLALNKSVIDAYLRAEAAKRYGPEHRNLGDRYLDKFIQLPIYLRSHDKIFKEFVSSLVKDRIGRMILPVETDSESYRSGKAVMDVLLGMTDLLGESVGFSPRGVVRRLNTLLVDRRLRPRPLVSDHSAIKELTDAGFLGLCLVQRTLLDDLNADDLRALSRDDALCHALASEGFEALYDRLNRRREAMSDRAQSAGESVKYEAPDADSGHAHAKRWLTILTKLDPWTRSKEILASEPGKRWLQSRELRDLVADFVELRPDIAVPANMLPERTGKQGDPSLPSSSALADDERTAVEQRTILDRAVRHALKLPANTPINAQHRSQVPKLRLSSVFSDEGLRLVLDHASSYTSLTTLDLAGTKVTDEGVKAIAAEGSVLKDLATLNLSGTKVTDEGVKAITAEGSVLKGLATLNLSGTKVTDEGVKAIAAEDSALKGLTTLSLWKTAITDEGVKAIAAEGSALKGLTRLSLWKTAITDEGVKAIAAEGSVLKSLTRLSLWKTAITDEGVKAMAAEGSALKSLAMLDLSFTTVTDDGVKAMAAEGSALEGLTTLDLALTKVSDDGVKAIAAEGSVLKRLTTLSLWSTKVTDDGVKAIVAANSVLKSLITLNLRHTKVTDDGVKAIAAEGSVLKSLTMLDLSFTMVTDEGVKAIAAANSALKDLTGLDLTSTKITDEGRALWRQVLDSRR